ncbi:MAG: NHL repeat-containing protein [Caldilineaceae bacterium]
MKNAFPYSVPTNSKGFQLGLWAAVILIIAALALLFLLRPLLLRQLPTNPAAVVVERRTLHNPDKAKKPAERFTPSGKGQRSAAAMLGNGELDTVADSVFGQNDFTSAAPPATIDGTTLQQASDLFVFDTGQIFIADTANNRVLGWDSVDTYAIGDPANLVLGQANFTTTTPLNPPNASSLNAPTGITMGFDGTLYVSDSGNHRVLVFEPINLCDFYEYYDDSYCIEENGYQFSSHYIPQFVSGMEAILAIGQPDMNTGTPHGTSATTLNHPMGLALDINENLVVADRDNNRVVVFEWPLETGMKLSWVIGQKSDGDASLLHAAPNPPTNWSMNAPTSIAVSTDAKELYVADTGNHRILVYNAESPTYQAEAVIGQPDFTSNTANNGGVSAISLNAPTGLKMDAGNRLYVADSDNNRVLIFDRVQPDAIADAVIGQPDFTTNTANQGGISAATLHHPSGIATDALFMDAYIADAGNNRVLQFYRPLENPIPVISELDPGTVRAGNDGFKLDIWGSGLIEETIVEVNGISRTVGSEFLGLTQVEISATEVLTTGQLTITLRNPAPGGGVSQPLTLPIYEPQSEDMEPDNVIGQEGFTSDAGPFAPITDTTLFGPSFTVVDPNSGRIFVSDMDNSRILSWQSSAVRTNGAHADLVFGKPDFETYFYNADAPLNLISPTGLALDSQGNLYAADADRGLVLVYRTPFTNGMAADLIIAGLDNPLALALDKDDNLYVADTYHHRVLFYAQPLTSRDTEPDQVLGQADLIAVEPNAGGAISASTLNYPSGLAIDPVGNLYVADSGNHRILLFLDPLQSDHAADLVFGQLGDFTTGIPNQGGISASTLNYPVGLTLDGNGTLYVADSDNHRVLRYDAPLTTDQIADLVFGQGGSFVKNQANRPQRSGLDKSGGGRLSLYQPTAVALNAAGDLFITDTGNNRLLNIWGARNVPATSPEGKDSVYLPLVVK